MKVEDGGLTAGKMRRTRHEKTGWLKLWNRFDRECEGENQWAKIQSI